MESPLAGASRTGAAVLTLFLLITVMGIACAHGDDLVPPRHSPERKAILNALRQVLEGSGEGTLDIVFVVRHLRVKDGWAWVGTDPCSKDGSSMYEPVEALLHKSSGSWQIETMRPCCGECEEDPDCADDNRYYRAVRRSFPEAPRIIFPE